MKKAYWILTALMLSVAVDGVRFLLDPVPVAQHYVVLFAIVVTSLILLGIRFGSKVRKTGKRRYLVLMTVTVAVLLAFVIFRMQIFQFLHNMFQPIMGEVVHQGCLPESYSDLR